MGVAEGEPGGGDAPRQVEVRIVPGHADLRLRVVAIGAFVLHLRDLAGHDEAVEEARASLIEAAAEADDKLIEKYLEGGELSQEELSNGLRQAVVSGKVVPIFTGSALKNIGFKLFLDAISGFLPSAKERKVVTITDGQLTAILFLIKQTITNGKTINL